MKLARGLSAGMLLACFTVLSSDGLFSQTKDKEAPKAKGQIPLGWGKLGLTAAQKQSIYGIQAEYKEKIKALEDEIKKLEAERYKKLVGVLNADQKRQLTAGLTPEASNPKEKVKD